MVTKLCLCIDVRIIKIRVQSGRVPVFVLQLHNETIDNEQQIIKYLNCKSTTQGQYTVAHNSDFAKLYRTTTGKNPKKRFSEAHKLVKHFLGYWFIAEFDIYQPPKGESFFKVAHIKAEAPAKNDAWTGNGTLKKIPKKATFTPNKSGDNRGTARGHSGDNGGTFRGYSVDCETLQASNSLGLEPVLNSTYKRPDQGVTTNPQDHVLDVDLSLSQTSNVFYYSKLANESTSDYHDRVINESFMPETWVN